MREWKRKSAQNVGTGNTCGGRELEELEPRGISREMFCGIMLIRVEEKECSVCGCKWAYNLHTVRVNQTQTHTHHFIFLSFLKKFLESRFIMKEKG